MTKEQKELIKEIFNSINCYFIIKRINPRHPAGILSLHIYDQDDDECLGFRPVLNIIEKGEPLPSGKIDPESWKKLKERFDKDTFIPLENISKV